MDSEISKDRQIELLANAIGDIAKQAMIISPDAELTGPQLLMAADSCSHYIRHLEDQVKESDAEIERLKYKVNNHSQRMKQYRKRIETLEAEAERNHW